jgi:hypothetical protein
MSMVRNAPYYVRKMITILASIDAINIAMIVFENISTCNSDSSISCC